MSFSYLASPYSHSDPRVVADRYLEAQKCFVWLLRQKIWTYSPIIHCHDLCQRFGLPCDAAFWWEYNREMLKSASKIYVLLLDGWQESRGVSEELVFADAANIAINFIHPSTYTITEEP
jgi:uncharacterized protein DUF1937